MKKRFKVQVAGAQTCSIWGPQPLVTALICIACGSNIPYLHLDFVISSHIPQPTIFYHIAIDHVGTQSSFASSAMLMRPG